MLSSPDIAPSPRSGYRAPAAWRYRPPPSRPTRRDADTIALGCFDGEEPGAEAPAELAALLAAGEARPSFKALALAHADGKRWLLVGLGKREDFTAERARVAAATARARARELSTRALCWEAPPDSGPEVAAALVEGTILADYRFERHKSAPAADEESSTKQLERLIVSSPADLAATVAEAALARRGGQRGPRPAEPARQRPHPDRARRARERARDGDRSLTVEVEGREAIAARGMGAFAAVAQGSEQEPALITLRYDGPQANGPMLGFVGKAVTFDSGGISLKPGAKMAEMKFDMSGGAAVIEAVAAIARLELASAARGGRRRHREPARAAARSSPATS